ncbi:MAG: oligosaccharide flippase family protein [Lachnospiraceae bacterium]|nr:oligosaccharide flippase family protein [Lachnospiraceae bacterium]
MKIERSKNASRNIIFGTLLKCYEILVPFIMRSVMVHELGVKYLGLNSLFTSILQVLNLAELGVGSAMVFSMYKPIAEDDTEKICAYMHMYKIYYRVIGAVIMLIGLVITPFVPRLIKGTVPAELNVYILYLLNLFATVLTYWLFSYRNSILSAHQRRDVISKVKIVTDTIKYLVQLLILVVFHNYYLYVIAILFTQAVNNIASAVISKKMYPEYDPKGSLSEEERKAVNQRIRDLFTSKLGGTIVGSADTIVISAFLGLEMLAMYQNYYHIMNSVLGFLTIIHSSIVAGVGNSMLVKSLEKNRKEFHTFTFLIAWVSTVCVSCFLVLYQPFMRKWMGKDMLLDNNMVLLFCIYFWVYEIVKMISVYKDAGGIWHEDRFRPLISGTVNLCLNLIMVQFIGIYGIVLSTIISVCFISIPWIINNVHKLIFKESTKGYWIEIIKYTISIFATGLVCQGLSMLVPGHGVGIIIIKGMIAVVVSNIAFLLLYRNSPYYDDSKTLLYKMLKHGKNKTDKR